MAISANSARGHELWSSKLGFIMAAVGSSVGLGNLWRFSAEAGQNGGGAFILVYLLCVVFIGIPVLMSEYIIGRGSDAASAVKSTEDLATKSGRSSRWSLLAWIGMIAAFLVVCFYSVVAGWVIAYIPKFIGGAFVGRDAQEIAGKFTTMISDPMSVLPYFTAFIVLTAWLVARGVNKGIEWAAKILMPIFFLLLAGLAVYSLVVGLSTEVVNANGSKASAAGKAIGFMFKPDFSAINLEVAVSALGQAFFSIGIGSAIMITYGSYLPRNVNIPKSAIIVALTDSGVALIAGLAIFPIVFAHGLAVNSGAGLFFETLPIALSTAAGGQIIGAGFFILAIFAAVTSSISLLEPSVSWLIDKTGMARREAAFGLGFFIWAVGSGAVFSQAHLGFLDNLTGTIMLPLSGLLVVLFVGWRLKKSILAEELGETPALLLGVLMFLVRYVAPIFVAIIFFGGVAEKYLGMALFN